VVYGWSETRPFGPPPQMSRFARRYLRATFGPLDFKNPCREPSMQLAAEFFEDFPQLIDVILHDFNKIR